VIDSCPIRLAVLADAPAIAVMSRDLIETGLGWRWTPRAVAALIRNRSTNVAVAYAGSHLAGFGIMQYADDDAHLLLFAVRAMHRRGGLGSSLLAWLETAAVVAGIEMIFLEARSTNAMARAFYAANGYRELAEMPNYYANCESAVRLGKDLALANAPHRFG
jgi:[ribosomal protein S18]-alanine N-acetyltransferase